MIPDNERTAYAKTYFGILGAAAKEKRNLNEMERRFVQDLESADKDFLGELRQAATEARVKPVAQDPEERFRLAQGALAPGEQGFALTSIPSISGIIDYALEGESFAALPETTPDLTFSDLAVRGVVNQMTGREKQGPVYGIQDVKIATKNLVESATGNPELAEVVGSVVAGSADANLRIQRALPFLGPVVSATFESGASDTENMIADIASGVAGIVMGGPVAGAINIGSQTAAAGGDANEVVASIASAAAGGQIGKAIAPSAASAIIAGEVAQLVPLSLEVVAREPELAAKMMNGERLTYEEEQKLAGTAIAAGIGASAGIVGGVIGNRATRSMRAQEAAAIEGRTAGLKAAEEAAQGVRQSLGDDILVRAEAALKDAKDNPRAGRSALAVGPSSRAAEAMALDAKRRITGDPNAILSEAELKTATDRYTRGDAESLYVPDDETAKAVTARIRQAFQDGTIDAPTLTAAVESVSLRGGKAVEDFFQSMADTVSAPVVDSMRSFYQGLRSEGDKIVAPPNRLARVEDIPRSAAFMRDNLGYDLDKIAVAQTIEEQARNVTDPAERQQMIEIARTMKQEAIPVPKAGPLSTRDFNDQIQERIANGSARQETVEAALGFGKVRDLIERQESESGVPVTGRTVDEAIDERGRLIAERTARVEGLRNLAEADKAEIRSIIQEMKAATKEINASSALEKRAERNALKRADRVDKLIDKFDEALRAKLGKRDIDEYRVVALNFFGGKSIDEMDTRLRDLRARRREIESQFRSTPGYAALREQVAVTNEAIRQVSPLVRVLKMKKATEGERAQAIKQLQAVASDASGVIGREPGAQALLKAIDSTDQKAIASAAEAMIADLKKAQDSAKRSARAQAVKSDTGKELVNILKQMDDLTAGQDDILDGLAKARLKLDKINQTLTEGKVGTIAREIDDVEVREQAALDVIPEAGAAREVATAKRETGKAERREKALKIKDYAERMKALEARIVADRDLAKDLRAARGVGDVKTRTTDVVGQMIKSMTDYDRGLLMDNIDRTTRVIDVLTGKDAIARATTRELAIQEYEDKRALEDANRRLLEVVDEQIKEVGDGAESASLKAQRDILQADADRLAAEASEMYLEVRDAILDPTSLTFKEQQDAAVQMLMEQDGMNQQQALNTVYEVQGVLLSDRLQESMDVFRARPETVAVPTEMIDTFGLSGPLGPVASDQIRMVASLAASQDILGKSIDAALRGQNTFLTRIMGNVSDWFVFRALGFGSDDANIVNYINDGGPDASSAAVARGLLKQTIESSFTIDNAARSYVYSQVDSGNWAEKARRRMLQIFEMPDYRAFERAAIDGVQFDMMRAVESRDDAAVLNSLRMADIATNGKETIKDYAQTRTFRFYKGATQALDKLASYLNSVGVRTRQNYFPRQLNPNLVDSIRTLPREESSSLIATIADSAYDRAIAAGKNPIAAAADREAVARGLNNVRDGNAKLDPDALFKMPKAVGPMPNEYEAVVNLAAESSNTMSRDLGDLLPETFIDGEGKIVNILSRDLEGNFNSYIKGASRVIASRAILAVDDSGQPRRLAPFLQSMQDSRAKDALLNFYRQVATGHTDSNIGNSPYFRALAQIQQTPGIKAVKGLIDNALYVLRPLVISASLPTQLLSYTRLAMDQGLGAVVSASLPGAEQRAFESMAKIAAEGVGGRAEMARELVARMKSKKGYDPTKDKTFRTMMDFMYNEASNVVRDLESLQGQIMETDPTARLTKAAANVIGAVSGVTTINRFVNNVATRAAVANTNGLWHAAIDKGASAGSRANARWDIENVLGISDVDRFLETGPLPQDYVTAARNSRVRANAVDQTILEKPIVLRHWLTRQMFSLASVAMIQGSNFSMELERARAMQGRTQPAPFKATSKRALTVAFALILAGAYREATDILYDRTQPSDSPLANYAMGMASELGYTFDAIPSLFYNMKLGRPISSWMMDLTFGGAATASRVPEMVIDGYRMAEGSSSVKVENFIPMARYATVMDNIPQFGDDASDYVDDLSDDIGDFLDTIGLTKFMGAAQAASNTLALTRRENAYVAADRRRLYEEPLP